MNGPALGRKKDVGNFIVVCRFFFLLRRYSVTVSNEKTVYTPVDMFIEAKTELK